MTTAGTDVWTIGRLLTWTTDFLKRHGSESPRLDAEVLLAHSRGCQRIELYTAFTDVADDAVRASFRELVKKRADGTPVAYLVGRREFYSLSFQVSPAVLIPRPETELLVIETLDRIKLLAGDEPVRIGDVGTGSGAIAVSLAKHSTRAQLTAIDLSDDALAVARANAAEHGVADRIEFMRGDLLSGLPAEPTFAFFVSNAPYVSESEWTGLVREVRDHEPRLALVGGPTGSEIIGRLIPQAADRLVDGGWLLLEISPMIEIRVRDLIVADGRFGPPVVKKDLAGLARVVAAQRSPRS